MRRFKIISNNRCALIIAIVLITLVSCDQSKSNSKNERSMKKTDEMPTFVIEREMENVGNSTAEELKAGAKKSNLAIEELGPDIQWKHSYVVKNKLYCVFKAKDKSLIREHARKVGVPANSINEVTAITNPQTEE